METEVMQNLGNPPNFNEIYLEYFDPVSKSFEVRRRSRTEGNLSITECMEYIDTLLKSYQLTFVPNSANKNLIIFPFMFIEPLKGDKILNKTTGEIYTVDQIIKNPSSGLWEGVVRLNLIKPPSLEDLHDLQYMSRDRLVRFNHEIPDDLPNPIGANLEKILKNPPPIPPTITWTIKSMQPASLGQINDSKREWKPRLRESLKDPLVMGHTVQIYGQAFDNLVQFDSIANDPRTSHRLANWFEQFMRLYGANLRKAGLINLLFWQRIQDETNQTWRQAFSSISSQYQIRTEQITAIYSRDILKIDISISASQTDPVNRKFNETRWIADQMVTGDLNSEEYRSLFYRSGEYLFGNIDIRH